MRVLFRYCSELTPWIGTNLSLKQQLPALWQEKCTVCKLCWSDFNNVLDSQLTTKFNLPWQKPRSGLAGFAHYCPCLRSSPGPSSYCTRPLGPVSATEATPYHRAGLFIILPTSFQNLSVFQTSWSSSLQDSQIHCSHPPQA